MSETKNGYDEFWHRVESHPDERVRAILPQKGRLWGSLSPSEKHVHNLAIMVMREDIA